MRDSVLRPADQLVVVAIALLVFFSAAADGATLLVVTSIAMAAGCLVYRDQLSRRSLVVASLASLLAIVLALWITSV